MAPLLYLPYFIAYSYNLTKDPSLSKTDCSSLSPTEEDLFRLLIFSCKIFDNMLNLCLIFSNSTGGNAVFIFSGC